VYGDVRILGRAPLTFVGVDGEGVHAPLVRARVAGVEALFVLDTGSEVHLLTKEHVDRAGLAFEQGEDGVDHSGTVMPSWSVEDSDLELAGLELLLQGIVAIPAPAPFPPRGIGGAFSPQHLHPSATAVLDMVGNELLLVEADDAALLDFLASRNGAGTTLSLERVRDFPTVVVISLAVKGFAETPTLLDTGGKRTEFAEAAVPGLEFGAAESLGAGVSGAAVRGAEAGAQVLVVGGHEVPVAALAVRESMPGPPGLIGMDVLRGTVLACAADAERPVVWQL
jgi:hypothetical protein